MGRPKNPRISRRKTLEVALRIADEEGLESLSIRRLANELEINGASLYHHFANKDEILVGVARLALVRVRTPTGNDRDWREWLLDNAAEYRAALLRHPQLATLLIRRHPLRIGIDEHDATTARLRESGVPDGLIMPMLEALEALALGSAIYRSGIEHPNETVSWRDQYPSLYQALNDADMSDEMAFLVCGRAVIDALNVAFRMQKPIGDW
jgi:TetR/AcrR family tetracycline transcriptional repressor